jgi:hypothetical protein
MLDTCLIALAPFFKSSRQQRLAARKSTVPAAPVSAAPRATSPVSALILLPALALLATISLLATIALLATLILLAAITLVRAIVLMALSNLIL